MNRKQIAWEVSAGARINEQPEELVFRLINEGWSLGELINIPAPPDRVFVVDGTEVSYWQSEVEVLWMSYAMQAVLNARAAA